MNICSDRNCQLLKDFALKSAHFKSDTDYEYHSIKRIIEQLLGRVKCKVKMELVKSVLVYYVVGRRDIDPDVGMSCIVN